MIRNRSLIMTPMNHNSYAAVVLIRLPHFTYLSPRSLLLCVHCVRTADFFHVKNMFLNMKQQCNFVQHL